MKWHVNYFCLILMLQRQGKKLQNFVIHPVFCSDCPHLNSTFFPGSWTRMCPEEGGQEYQGEIFRLFGQIAAKKNSR